MSTISSSTTSSTAYKVTADTTGTLVLQTGSTPTTAVTINSTQGVQFNAGISVGGTGPASEGSGVKFPATQIASSDANTLDDYEEGTWTPAQGSGLTVIGAFTASGKYTKIGRQVYVSGRLSAATSIATTAGTQFCTGLPFTVLESAALGSFTNNAVTSFGGLAAFSTQVYSTTTMAATSTIDFSCTYTV